MRVSQIKNLSAQYAEEVRFLVVGGLGFSINFVALWALHGHWHMNLVPAQLIASELAVLSNFTLHHNWTYRDYSSGRLWHRLAKFHATAWTGALIGSVVLWLGVGLLGLHYLIALALGAGVAMIWNYCLNKYVVWAKTHAGAAS